MPAVLPIYKRQNKPDVLNYIRIVSEGQYYEEFGKILKNRGLIPDDVEDVRKFAKIATYASFFSSNLLDVLAITYHLLLNHI